MFMNIDQVPAGQSYYTVFAGDSGAVEALLDGRIDKDDFFYEEIDLIASSSATADKLLELAKTELAEGYDDNMVILGISNQSVGYFPYLSEAGRMLV